MPLDLIGSASLSPGIGKSNYLDKKRTTALVHCLALIG